MVLEHGVSEPATPLLPSDGIVRAVSSDNAMRLPVSTSPVVMSGRPQDLPGSVGSSGGGGTSADIEDSSRRVLGLVRAVHIHPCVLMPVCMSLRVPACMCPGACACVGTASPSPLAYPCDALWNAHLSLFASLPSPHGASCSSRRVPCLTSFTRC